ncbi:hypothetical protein CQZ93_15620 [Ochrobactrum vermis]|nr:hypothetical protein CQZ93_15620 [Ochrobactrum vermis]
MIAASSKLLGHLAASNSVTDLLIAFQRAAFVHLLCEKMSDVSKMSFAIRLIKTKAMSRDDLCFDRCGSEP